MNEGCKEGKMTCGKSILPTMTISDIIRVDFPKIADTEDFGPERSSE